MSRVLVIEDNERLAAYVCRAIEQEGIEADACADLSAAEYILSQQEYSAMILDRGLPDGDGLSLLKGLRNKGIMIPCLVLTAQSAIHDRVLGLEAGADDYLSKPFEMIELVARVKALLRRPTEMKTLAPAYGDLQLFPNTSMLQIKDQSVLVAPAEREILFVLIQAGEMTIRRSKLEQAAWGVNNPVTPNALDVALHRIRKKLQEFDSDICINNVRGVGYALQKKTTGI